MPESYDDLSVAERIEAAVKMEEQERYSTSFAEGVDELLRQELEQRLDYTMGEIAILDARLTERRRVEAALRDALSNLAPPQEAPF